MMSQWNWTPNTGTYPPILSSPTSFTKAHLARWSRATGQALGQPSGLGEDSGLRHGDKTYCLTHFKTSNAEEEKEEWMIFM